MHPINIVADNITILFPRQKKYNSAVLFTDLSIYFRYHGKLVKRCITVLTKKRILIDYKDLLDLFDRQEWTKEEKKYELEWVLCNFKNISELKKYKRPIIRYVYDDPESEEIHEDQFIMADKNEYGHKPYLTEIIMPDTDLTADVLKKAAKMFLKECFNVKVKIESINLIKNMDEQQIKEQWQIYKKKKDQDQVDSTIGRQKRVVFLEEAARQLFGDDVKSVIIEGNKTTITYITGEIVVEIRPKLKFVRKRRHTRRKYDLGLDK